MKSDVPPSVWAQNIAADFCRRRRRRDQVSQLIRAKPRDVLHATKCMHSSRLPSGYPLCGEAPQRLPSRRLPAGRARHARFPLLPTGDSNAQTCNRSATSFQCFLKRHFLPKKFKHAWKSKPSESSFFKVVETEQTKCLTAGIAASFQFAAWTTSLRSGLYACVGGLKQQRLKHRGVQGIDTSETGQVLAHGNEPTKSNAFVRSDHPNAFGTLSLVSNTAFLCLKEEISEGSEETKSTR